MKIMIVGGVFDRRDGRPSGLVTKVSRAIARSPYVTHVTAINGGRVGELLGLLGACKDHDAVLWWPSVANAEVKMRDIKTHAPRTLTVMSKRNDDRYDLKDLVSRGLAQRANLMVEFRKTAEGPYEARVLDPLGCQWSDMTSDLDTLVEAIVGRLGELRRARRRASVRSNVPPSVPEDQDTVPNDPQFFDIVRAMGDRFHALIEPPEGQRFLGNASFRCRHGFPSFTRDGIVYMSRRNVDKRLVGAEFFVPTRLTAETTYYTGDHKPSVDTPIQQRLYNHFGRIRYMVHGHVYVPEALMTSRAVPCGDLREVDEVTSIVDADSMFFAINLKGHGFLAGARDCKDLASLAFVPRPMPELCST